MLQKAGILIVTLSAVMVGACSRQAWYEGGKESARQTCYRKANNEAVQRCLEEINRLPYEEYQKEREALQQAPGTPP